MFIIQHSKNLYDSRHYHVFLSYSNKGLRRLEDSFGGSPPLGYAKESYQDKADWMLPFKLEIITE
jgi:hypothetical protein